jgi:2-polyprenyl-3-methyl-5-hydroxy-6-metoxy-1,4-benzoquinol methylase
MKLIIKIINLLGYDIVKYYDSNRSTKMITKLHSVSPIKVRAIKKDEATLALQSVGRFKETNSFTYFQRPDKSSREMDNLEHIWWDSNGNLVEKVWVFSEDVNVRYRQQYVKRAINFFSKNRGKNKILDLGCGSGWFGRMIADNDLEYHGMDFSATQIEIANNFKEKASNKINLNYYCLNDFKKLKNIDSITGVVIHAFLHHLYWEELHKLFNELVEVLPNGCKFFITEPIYPDQSHEKIISRMQEKSNNDFVKAFRLKLDLIKTDLINKDLYDTETECELMSLISESSDNHFFLSPKEVPFKFGEFQSFLTKYLTIESFYHCGVLNLETAQLVEKIKTKELKTYYSNLLFPMANSIDDCLIANNYFETNPSSYLFTVFECVLKKENNI